jgi:hypothetical protein
MSATPKYIDVSQSSFTITPDGKYCYEFKAKINGQTIHSNNCFKITSDSFSDRVLCMSSAITNAYFAYVKGTGATAIVDATQQQVFNEVVLQFLSAIKSWGLCDVDKFMAVHQKYIDDMPLKVPQVIALMNQQSQLIKTALTVNGCKNNNNTPSGSSSYWEWYSWVALVVGIVIVCGGLWWVWKQKTTNASALVTPSHAKSVTHKSSTRRSPK